VESAAWGSFFLDLTGTRLLWGSGADAAVKVRDRIKGAVGFSPKLGLAVNKLVSEVAEGLVQPLEIYSVFPGEEGRFLSPLPLPCLPRLGNATRRVFEEELGIGTIGLLAGLPAMLLTSVFGKEGMNLSRMARGEDTTAVEPSSQASSLRFSIDLTGGENGRELLQAALFQLCEELGRSLRTRNRLPGRLLLEIDYADGLTVKGLHPAGHPDDDLDLSLFAKSSALFHKLLKRRVRVKRIVLGAPDLRLPLPQLPLFSWDASHDRARTLMGAIDQVRKKFGDHALFFGRRCA
jgi:DNA polymerase-4